MTPWFFGAVLLLCVSLGCNLLGRLRRKQVEEVVDDERRKRKTAEAWSRKLLADLDAARKENAKLMADLAANVKGKT